MSKEEDNIAYAIFGCGILIGLGCFSLAVWTVIELVSWVTSK